MEALEVTVLLAFERKWKPTVEVAI